MPAPKELDSDSPAAVWGSELRHYREAAGLSQEQLAERISYSRSQIQALESGTRNPVSETANALDDVLDARGALIRLRNKLLKRAVPWPSFRPWSEVELEATALRGYESVVVPGLLQSPAYARLLLKDNEDAISVRMERQEILTKDKPPSVRYLLDEWVLKRPIGGGEVMSEQLERIEQAIVNGFAKVQISPSGSVPSVSGSFVLATLEGETLGYQEATTEGMVMTGRDDVLKLEAAYDELLAEALPSGASLEAIRRMKDQWQKI